MVKKLKCFSDTAHPRCHIETTGVYAGCSGRYVHNNPRYFIRTPYNGVLASQTRHDYCPQSSMIRGVMSPGLVGRW